MKLKLLTFSLLSSFLILGYFFYTKAETPAAPVSIAMNVDPAPISESAGGFVTSYADSLTRITPAVVSVFSHRRVVQPQMPFPNDPFLERFFGPRFRQEQQERIQRGLGSGVIISQDGFILTNNHVIEGATDVRVALADGREFSARIVGTDPQTDVGILKIDAEDLPTAVLADSDNLRVGDIAFAVGNPLGVGQTVTMGIVSATGRTNLGLIDAGFENFIQTDASINPGNSGGALVDALGRVIGINTAIISTSRGNIGIGFAIPINMAAHIMKSIVETGTVSRGFLGVSMQELDANLAREFGLPDARGALIADVTPGSPAERAGIKIWDVILAVNERRINNISELRLAIAALRPGSEVRLRVFREGAEINLVAVLDDRESSLAGMEGLGSNELMPGIVVAPVTDELRRELQLFPRARGLVVTEVQQGSPFADVLTRGVVIEQINRRSVSTVTEGREALQAGRNVLYVNLRGVYRFVLINIER